MPRFFFFSALLFLSALPCQANFCTIITTPIQEAAKNFVVAQFPELQTLTHEEKTVATWITIQLIEYASVFKYQKAEVENALVLFLQKSTPEDKIELVKLYFEPHHSNYEFLMSSNDTREFVVRYQQMLDDKMPFQKGAGWNGNIFRLMKTVVKIYQTHL